MSAIVEFSKRSKAALKANLELVRDGTLTVEEAAKCLAGARMKAREELGGNTGGDPDSDYRAALVDLETRLPGFRGLQVGRHV